MGTEIEKQEPQTKDITKPWRRQFFECKDKGPEPPINADGFWKKPEHGIPIKKGK
jgi:hypothetical protein